MVDELDLNKVRRVLDNIFDMEPNIAEIYLIVDSLSRVLMSSVSREDQIKVLKALLTTTIMDYFKVRGREDIDPSKASEAVEDLLETISEW